MDPMNNESSVIWSKWITMKPVIEVPLKSKGPSINDVGNWEGRGEW